MSTTFEYRHLALQVPDPNPMFGEQNNLYMVMVEAGASNSVRNDGTLSRRWETCLIGNDLAVMKAVCTLSQYAEGGVTQLARSGRRGTSPESYIRHYRRVLERALSLEESIRILSDATIKFSCPDLLQHAGSLAWVQSMQGNDRLRIPSEDRYELRLPSIADGPLLLSRDLDGLSSIADRNGYERPMWWSFDGQLDSLLDHAFSESEFMRKHPELFEAATA